MSMRLNEPRLPFSDKPIPPETLVTCWTMEPYVDYCGMPSIKVTLGLADDADERSLPHDAIRALKDEMRKCIHAAGYHEFVYFFLVKEREVRG